MKESILIVAPHPDDETLGCGGAIAGHVAGGREVSVVVLTNGANLFAAVLNIRENPTPREVCDMRRAETRQAAAILGVDARRVLFWDFEDGMLRSQSDAAAAELSGLVRRVAPSVVYVTSPFEAHPDHVAASAIVERACSAAGNAAAVLQYVIHLRSGLTVAGLPADVVADSVDIAPYLPLKKKAVAEFKSHRTIISPLQVKPLASFDEFLEPQEWFIRRAASDTAGRRGGR